MFQELDISGPSFLPLIRLLRKTEQFRTATEISLLEKEIKEMGLDEEGGEGADILNSTVSSSSLVVTTTSWSLTNGSKCTSGDSGASSPASYHISHTLQKQPMTQVLGERSTSSLSSPSSSFLRVKEDAAPNPPAVVGALHALALLVPNLNPPKRGCCVVLVSSLVGVGSGDPNEPKILVDFSAAAFAVLEMAGLTVSMGVAASTLVGVAVVDVDTPASEGFCSGVFARGVEATSSATGASLVTPDIFWRCCRCEGW